MACSAVTYHGVNQKVFDCLKSALEKAGIKVPDSHSGTISGHGIKADFKWDGNDSLWIKVTDKPFIITCSYVVGKIHSAIHGCGGQ